MTHRLEDLGLRRPLRERLLWGEQVGVPRSALWPLETAYRLGVLVRNRAYDLGWLPETHPSIPSVAIGNLTVGGAGKTPFAAWAARALHESGRRPAVVLRGYGGDEAAVHALLNPGIPTFVDRDRARAIAAAAGADANVALLDDAFQHRRLRATLRVLLVAAEDLLRRHALLPRGPWREPLSAARRADLVVVTRKSASPEEAVAAERTMGRHAPVAAKARIALRSEDVRELRHGTLGRSVLDELRAGSSEDRIGVAGVARPESVWQALQRLGLKVTQRVALGDHHAYTPAQARALAELAGPGGIVTTLKDAVKLRPLLPLGSPLFVLTQEVTWESGREHWEAAVRRLFPASHAERARR